MPLKCKLLLFQNYILRWNTVWHVQFIQELSELGAGRIEKLELHQRELSQLDLVNLNNQGNKRLKHDEKNLSNLQKQI